MTVPVKPKYRTMWMFPRNIRRIEPWKLSQISSLLNACQVMPKTQSVQDDLYAQLAELGVKRRASDYGVENPGGFRTYLAQLSCLGLFYKNNNEFYPTIAGKHVMEGNDPTDVLRCQLLRMQFPSVYGNGRNVSVDPKLKVRPFAFLIHLMQDPDLSEQLTQEEMAIPVIYAHTSGDYEKCKEKILCLRNLKLSIRDLIDDVNDVCTPKRWNNPLKGLSNEELLANGIKDALEIANTAKNYLLAAGLINVEKTDEDIKYCKISDDPKVKESIIRWMGDWTKVEKLTEGHEIQWQYRYGRYSQTKVTVPSLTKKQQVDGLQCLIQTSFISQADANPFGLDIDEFVEVEAKRWNISKADVEKYISSIRSKSRNIFRDKVMHAAYSGGTESFELEKAVTNIFIELGFDQTENIAQKKAKSRSGGYPDTYVRASSLTKVGFADAKATSRYDFPLSDREKLKSYYHDCWLELDPQYPAVCFIYIAGGFQGKDNLIKTKLRDCQNNYGRPVCAITVAALLDLLDMKSRPTADALGYAFCQTDYYNSARSILDAAKKFNSVLS